MLPNKRYPTSSKLMHQMYRKYVPNIMDDSLSLYEQMIAVIEHINNVVRTSDSLSDEITKDMNELITEVNNIRDFSLPENVTKVLKEWQSSGFLDVAISEALQWELDEYKTINEQDKLSFTTQLHQIATLVQADTTGVIPASDTINALIANAKDGESIHFPQGTYNIDKPIFWDKKVKLFALGNVTLRASTPIEAVIVTHGFSTYTLVELENFYLDGNNLATHCLKISGAPIYVTKMKVKGVSCRHALSDGIIIVPPAWSIKFEDCLSNSHGRDGIRAIIENTPQQNQINHVTIENSTINDNQKNGINILGIALSIRDCDIEGNEIGIRFDSALVVSDTYHINIENNYIEGNTHHQIYAASNTGDGVFLNIENNYINTANQGLEIIKCAGGSETITILMDKNRFDNASPNILVDGGNTFHRRSYINGGMYLRQEKMINLGFARLVDDDFTQRTIPMTTSFGAKAISAQQSENFIGIDPRQAIFIVDDVSHRLLQYVQCQVISDCTNASIDIIIQEINPITSENIRTTMFTTVGSNDFTAIGSVVNNWGLVRVDKGNILVIQFNLMTYTSGTTFAIKNPTLSYI